MSTPLSKKLHKFSTAGSDNGARYNKGSWNRIFILGVPSKGDSLLTGERPVMVKPEPCSLDGRGRWKRCLLEPIDKDGERAGERISFCPLTTANLVG